MMRRVLPGMMILILLISPLQAEAGVPLDTVEAHVKEVLDILRDPALQGEADKKVKEEKIETIANEMFDYVALSKLTLGRSWRDFNKEQQKEFVSLYRSILKKAYMDKILAYTDEQVVFDRDIMLSENKAEVHTRIITKSAEIPINYRLYLKDGQWKVYDVIVEGISLVQNYRTQFREILANNSPEEVLKILREKTGKS
ncbi:MAG: ABC transporter substrate-binding protein [Deltaproteobacteria bacterium]|jgi:phospholipid transport system substrate-binding protein|nr:ABC transporter substrate-binding protein [Deltaproteobacteria bacterium]